MDEIAEESITNVSAKLWSIINSLKLGEQDTKIVVNSKALHHLLPELVPPIDREYTLNFFFNNNNPYPGEKEFMGIYPHLIRIIKECPVKISKYRGREFYTSTTKVIDNAIVGFVLKEIKS